MLFFSNRVKLNALVAQLVEQLPFKEKVLGSIPSEGTKDTGTATARSFRAFVPAGAMSLCDGRGGVARNFRQEIYV